MMAISDLDLTFGGGRWRRDPFRTGWLQLDRASSSGVDSQDRRDRRRQYPPQWQCVRLAILCRTLYFRRRPGFRLSAAAGIRHPQ